MRQRKGPPFPTVRYHSKSPHGEKLGRNGRKRIMLSAPAPGDTPSLSFLLIVGAGNSTSPASPASGGFRRGTNAGRAWHPAPHTVAPGKEGNTAALTQEPPTRYRKGKEKQKKSESQRPFKQESRSLKKNSQFHVQY